MTITLYLTAWLSLGLAPTPIVHFTLRKKEFLKGRQAQFFLLAYHRLVISNGWWAIRIIYFRLASGFKREGIKNSRGDFGAV